MSKSTWCSLDSPLILSFISHLATETLLMCFFFFFLPTDADEFVCSSSYCRSRVPAAHYAQSRKSCGVFSSKVYFVFQLLLLLSGNEKCCACDYAVKTLPAPPFCIAKRDFGQIGLRDGRNYVTRRDESFFLGWRHECTLKRERVLGGTTSQFGTTYKTQVMQQAASSEPRAAFFRCISS